MSKVDKESKDKPVQALLNAVATSKLRLIRLLIEGGVYVDIRNDDDQTPLLITCSLLNNTRHIAGETREKVVKYLLSAGADVNAYDVTGRSPLIYAVITRASVISDLIDAGADPWWEDSSRKCAFDYAVQRQDIVQIKSMVEGYKRRKTRQNARNTRGILHDLKYTHESRNTRDVGEKRESQVYVDEISQAKQDKKSMKTKQERKPKVPQRNRKRLNKSRDISSPSLRSFKKSSTSKTPEPASPHRDALKDSTKDSNVNVKTHPNIQVHPSQSTTTNNDSQICGLCKTIFSEHAQHPQNEATDQSAPFDNLCFQEYDLSGFLYRRRSTESLFGLTEKRYESIRRKRELGITMEDLFSSTEINEPGEHPLYVKSPRTNTMVDISANELLVPDRARSLSVCLPPLDNTRQSLLHVGESIFYSRNGSPIITSAKSAPQLRPAAWSPEKNMVSSSESRVYLSSDEEVDELIFIPASGMTSSTIPNMTSSDTQSVTSSPDNKLQYCMTTQKRKQSAPSICCDSESETCNSPIPTIVLTDYVNKNKI